eukprot:TRINITY_DN26534_c0_g1_i1.p1 TRINITY_DN26534_c0_g1~~TRINITY_DN26534_c0_g1_i1.p1  ORF type:complete len:398 (+),score=93.33 TRINITY_DN26534_c0_g1_i1:97-1290(+)
MLRSLPATTAAGASRCNAVPRFSRSLCPAPHQPRPCRLPANAAIPLWLGARPPPPPPLQRARSPATRSQSRPLHTVREADELGGPDGLVAEPRALDASVQARLANYMVLGKVKLTALVTFTAGCGYVVAGGPLFAPGSVAVLAGTFLQGMSANTLNQVAERKLDAIMKRTRRRPLVTGAATVWEARAVARAELAAGTALLFAVEPVSAALGLACWGLYVGVYTPLKQRHWLNTWAGAVVGALPPVMGVAAAGGGVLSPAAVLVGGLLYFWQIPHFLSLAYLHRRDYAQAGFRMLPSQDVRRSANFSVRYCVYCTALTTVVPLHFAVCDPVFAAEALVLGAMWTRTAWRFREDPLRNARACFLASISYLPVILVLLVFHAKLGNFNFPPSLLCPLASD